VSQLYGLAATVQESSSFATLGSRRLVLIGSVKLLVETR
jgi:hypothetical protein